jgi:hypothetical protein
LPWQFSLWPGGFLLLFLEQMDKSIAKRKEKPTKKTLRGASTTKPKKSQRPPSQQQ